MSFVQIYGLTLAIIICLMSLLWLISLVLKNSSIVDIFWGSGFFIANWVYFSLASDGFLVRKLVIGLLVTIWGLRLTLHILTRNWGRPEDFRYQKWREEAGGKWWWQSLFRVFFLQGLLMWIISIPLLAAQSAAPSAGYLTVFDLLGIALWGIGFFFESVGDLQLARFKTDPANKDRVMDRGVWQYTRHPNYFGDSAQWWGYYLIAISAGGWWAVFSPILMTLFLLRVSGVALMEKTLKTRPGYREYIERTSAFIPWLPRKK
jgi:steroid 5-alpha reductase family enzyme